MHPFSVLKNSDAPISIVVLRVAGDAPVEGLTFSGLLAPLRCLEQQLGPLALAVTVLDINLPISNAVIPFNLPVDLALLVADHNLPISIHDAQHLAKICLQARYWGAVGAPVLWFANAGMLAHIRAALPWTLYNHLTDVGEQGVLVPNLFELDGHCVTCCGGLASLDFSLTLIQALFGADHQAQVMEELCVERVRDGSERQRIALHTRFGVLQPQLSEAVTLMENNIEEPLATDEIAQLVGLSRRQLERQFKQYLGSMPSRYYLELRLKKARQLLLDSTSSIVQIGLMCGFSSGAHFSTAFGAQFGVTPREERQRKLNSK